MTEVPADIRRKRLIYRSQHRGTKESDALLGRFAGRFASSMTDVELGLFEALLDQPDPDLVDWVLGSAPVPEVHDHELMRRLIRFNEEDGSC